MSSHGFIDTVEVNRTSTRVEAECDDDRVLREMGYRHELSRGFTRLSSFSFCYTSVAVLASLSMLYSYGLSTGGPAVMVWGWILTSVMTVLAGASLAEICSTYPSAGSVYHWSAEMGSKAHGPFWAFVTAWFNFLGNLASTVSTAYGFSEALSASAAIGQDGGGRGLNTITQVGVAMGVVASWGVLNTLRVRYQGLMSNFSTLFQVVSTLAIVLAVLAVPESGVRNSSQTVWFSTRNDTGLSASYFPYVAVMGLLSSTFALAGYESAAHVAEETTHASTSAPWAIVSTCASASVMGFIYLLGLLYATPDMASAAASDNGAVTTFVAACGPVVGRVLTNLLIGNLYFAGITSVTATSRIGFAMARDGLLPGSGFLRHVHPSLKVPLRMVVVTLVLSLLLLLLPLLTPLAFEAFTSIDTIGYQVSYCIPIILRIKQGDAFRRSSFHLGRASLPVAGISAVYLIVTSLMFLLPSKYPLTADNMNYTAHVLASACLVGGIYWLAFARHHYHGPRRLLPVAKGSQELTTVVDTLVRPQLSQ